MVSTVDSVSNVHTPDGGNLLGGTHDHPSRRCRNSKSNVPRRVKPDFRMKSIPRKGIVGQMLSKVSQRSQKSPIQFDSAAEARLVG